MALDHVKNIFTPFYIPLVVFGKRLHWGNTLASTYNGSYVDLYYLSHKVPCSWQRRGSKAW